VHVVASRCTIIACTPAALVDVIMGVSGLTIVDDAITDRGRFVPSWCGLRMNRCLFLLSGGLHRLLRCKPVVPRSKTLGLLHGHNLEETSNLIAGPTGLGGRWLGHIAKKHYGGDDILAGSFEDWGFASPILDDTMINVTSSLSSSSATCAHRGLPLEGLLKSVQVFSFLIEHGLQFLDLLKLCSLVRTKELGFVPCARGLNVRWRGVPPSNGRLGF
jgi:hypothetical protein